MKKKILSLLLALVMVFGVFIPVSTIDTSAAGAIYSVLDDVKTYQVDTYDELKTALTANETQRVIVLNGDIIVENSTQNISITPNLNSKKIVLDLNGYDISLESSAYTFRSIFTIDQAGWFHIINSKFDGTNNYSELSIDANVSEAVLQISNEQAEVSVMSGINLKSSNNGLIISACHRLYMYGVDITADYNGIYFTEKEKDIFAQSWFSFNDVVVTAGNNCVDLRGIAELDEYSIDIDFNHVILKTTSANAAIISKQTQLVPKDFKHAKSADPVYTYNNGHSTEPILYGTLENLRTDRNIAYYNNPFMGNGTPCTHSNKSDFLVTTRGHIVRCNDCFAYTEYTSHTGAKAAVAPTTTAMGNTAGNDCACGYKTYYLLPMETPIDPFTKVQEVATWSSLSVLLNTTKPTTIKLKNDIIVNDDNNDYTIKPRVRGNLVIDLNGYNIIVNSDKTQYLFDLSTATYGELGTNLSIVSSTDGGGGDVVLNTNQKNAAVVKLANKANSFTAIRTGIILGTETDVTTDSYAQTFAIDCSGAHQLNIYTADVYNYKQNGSAIRFNFSSVSTFRNTTVRIYRSKLSFKSFGLDFNNGSAVISASSFKDFTISNNTYFTPMNSTAKVLVIDGSANTIKLSDIVDTDFHFVDGTYSVSPDKTVAYDNFTAGKEYWTKWRWNSSNQCAHTDFVTVLYAEFGSYQYCTRCKKASAQAHHIIVDETRTTYADCHNDGEIFYICDDTGCGYEYSVKDISRGHIPGSDDEGKDIIFRATPATCTKDGISDDYFECFNCREFVLLKNNEIVNEADLVVPATGHDYKFIEKHAATCSSTGAKSDHWICKNCRNYFVTDAKTPITLHEYSKNIYLPKLSHDIKEVKAVAATCTKDGNIAYWVCGRAECGKFFSEAEATNEITDVTVKATGHSVTKITAVKATCTVNGTIEHYKCSKCSVLFSDAAATKVITDITAKAPGHTAGNWQVKVAAEVGKKGTEVKKCTSCNAELETRDIPALTPSHTHTLVLVKKVPATCTANGIIEHYKCSGCAKLFSDAAATKEIADATVKSSGHSYEWVVTKEAKVGVEGEKVNKCKTCGDVKETQKIPALSPDYMLGDVDSNSKVDATDARLALRAAVGLDKLNDTQKKAADVDKNATVDSTDARLILRAAVGLEKLK